MVHADVLKALQAYHPRVYIRYRGNVWKGKAYAASAEGRKEGTAMVLVYTSFARLTFCSDYLESPRLGRIIRKLFIQRLAKTINQCKNPVVIFWHRESIEFLWPYLKPHVRIIDIVHNNSNNETPDASYLVNDWVPRLQHRVLVSEGLKKWLIPLYQTIGHPEEWLHRCTVIQHAEHIPEQVTKQDPLPLHIAFVGRDSAEKRFPLVLQIAQRCLEEKLDVQFHLAGPPPEPFASQSPENCIWYGEVRDRKTLHALYQKTHVLLLTSSSEGFPKVVAEAMAFGCIPLVTDVGGMKDHLVHRQNGLLTTAEHCMAESMQWIHTLTSDREFRTRLSESAQAYASQTFDFATFEAKWEQIIHASG